MVAKVERTAAMVQPAHDHLVPGENLLPIDTEVLPRLVRAPRDGKAPGDQGSYVAGPAGLHGQPCKINVAAFPHDLLAWRRPALLGSHVHDLQEYRPRVLPGVLQALRRL